MTEKTKYPKRILIDGTTISKKTDGLSQYILNTVAYLDADKLCGKLELRRWKSGDRFVPFGMKGFKKVRDYLRDRKLSLFEKEKVMVVTSGDEIVWVVNERTDNRFRVDNKTKRVVELEVSVSK